MTMRLAWPRLREEGLLGLAALAVAALLALPVLVVVGHLALPWSATWTHLRETVLADYVVNTVVLVGGVGLGVAVIGVATAWLATMCDFPGRRVVEWALVLPLAVPAYVIAYTYTDLLQYAGPVQTMLRDAFGWSRDDYWFPHVRSLGGAVVMLVFVLYPYVYLLARAAFINQSVCVLDVSRTLGAGPWSSFLRVALPLARPALAAGVALALMETVADFGTVSFFAVPTFTTGIYKAWFSMGDRVVATQMAAILLLVVLAILAGERASRGSLRFHQTSRLYRPLVRYRLRGWRAGAAIATCALPLAIGFLIPVIALARMAMIDGFPNVGPRFTHAAVNTLVLAGGAAIVTLGVALLLAQAVRARPRGLGTAAQRIAMLGYAVPGSVMAVGILVPLTALDNTVDAGMRSVFGIATGLVLTGSAAALVFAYVARFLAVGLQAIDASLAKVSPSMDGAARSLGERPWGVLVRIHLPLAWGGALSAALLVFVDVLKELPATLLMRPFNMDTLAVLAHNLASDERLGEASLPALAIVVVGLAPIVLLSRAVARSRPGHAAVGGAGVAAGEGDAYFQPTRS